jgi:hypothetical protein
MTCLISTRVFTGGLALAFVLLAPKLSAQQRDSSRAGGQHQHGQMDDHMKHMEQMAPMMGRMTEASLTATLGALSKPEAAEQLATFTRNYYQALVKKGFTEDEALRIVLAVGVPVPGGR